MSIIPFSQYSLFDADPSWMLLPSEVVDPTSLNLQHGDSSLLDSLSQPLSDFGSTVANPTGNLSQSNSSSFSDCFEQPTDDLLDFTQDFSLLEQGQLVPDYDSKSPSNSPSNNFDEALLRLTLRQFKMAIANMSPDDQLRAKRARRTLQNMDASKSMRKRTKEQQQQLRDSLAAQQAKRAAIIEVASACARKHFGDHPMMAAFLTDVASALQH